MGERDPLQTRRLTDSFRYAWAGLVQIWKDERNIKIHFLAACGTLLAAVIAGLDRLEVAVLIAVIGLVVIAEVFNTVVEVLVDMITVEYHPLAAKAKNMSAGAVLVAAIVAVAAGVVIFVRSML